MRASFLDFKEYYKKAIIKVPNDSFFKESINHKFRHSIEVLYTGERIIKGTPELNEQSGSFKQFARIALLFHDVGRFEEAVKRHNTPNLVATSESLNQYDHGLIGYNELKNTPCYNDIRILLAVRYHGKMMNDIKSSELWEEAKLSPEGKEAKKILYLVRDADKIANLEVIKREDHLRKDLFFNLLSEDAKNAGLSFSAKQQFFAKQTVLSKTLTSFADRILMVISWIFDLNYKKTKELFIQNKYDTYLLSLLAQYHHNENEIKHIKQFIDDYMKE